MSSLLPFGLLGVALLGIAYLTWRFRSVAKLRHALGRPFFLLAHACLSAVVACHKAYEKSLSWSETVVVVRLVYLCAALAIFLGDYSISRLRGAALMGLSVQPISWLPLENFAGLLWLLVPALLGSAAVELLGVIPSGWRLFSHTERMPMALRWLLAGLTGLLFLLSLLVSACFVLWGQLALMQSTTSINQDVLALYIVACFGVLLAFVSCIAFYAVLVGLGAVVSLLLGVAVGILHVLRLAAILLGSVIANTMVKDTTQQQEPTLLEPSTSQSHRDHALPAENEELVLSETESEEVNPMASIHRNITALGFGQNSARFVSLLLEHTKEVGASGIFLGYGVVDPSHTYRKETLPTIVGVQNYSPATQVIQLAYADEVLASGMAKLALMLQEQIVEAHALLQSGVVFVAVDLPELEAIAPALDELHTRKPNVQLVVVCPLSRLDRQQHTSVQEAVTLLKGLKERGTVAVSVVIDANSSAQATLLDAITIEKATIQTLVSLAIAVYSDECNPSLNGVLLQLGICSPFAGLAFTAAPVVSGKIPFTWQMVKAAVPSVGDRGFGDMSDIITQATNSTKRLLAEQTLTASPAPLDAQKLCFLLYHLPYARGDRRFEATATSLNRFVRAKYPNAQAIIVHGNGIALPGLSGKFRVGVSCMYPLVFSTTKSTESLLLNEVRGTEEAGTPRSNGNGRRKHETV